MTIQDIEYKEAGKLLIRMGYQTKHIREIVKKNIEWERKFLIERADELEIPYMREFFLAFQNKITVKEKNKRKKIRTYFGIRKIFRDLETGIIYDSVSDAQENMQISQFLTTKYLKNGRFEVIAMTAKERNEKKDFYLKSTKMFKYITSQYCFFLDEIEKKDRTGCVLERYWMLNQVRKKEEHKEYKIDDFLSTELFAISILKAEIVKKIKEIAGSEIVESLFYDSVKKDYVFILEE